MAEERGAQSSKYREHRPWQDLDTMLSVDEARRRILAGIEPLAPRRLPLLECVGLVLAEDVTATVSIPPFRNSAMDGYAVRAVDTERASYDDPVLFELIADLPAGVGPAMTVGPHKAVRIMTGAVMPDGADAVVRFEETDEFLGPPAGPVPVEGDARSIWVYRAAKPWQNVREAGEDVAAGATVLRAGTVLNAAEIGLLAALNRDSALVHPRPLVGVLSTGDEVIDIGPELEPGQIRNSNSYTLAAMVLRHGGTPLVLGVAKDRVDHIRDKLRQAASVDFLVTSGGVSLGDYDMVKDVLQSEGRIDLWQVRIKPGKPMAYGSIAGVPLLGLPGNPVAAFVGFQEFGRPVIRRMLGLPEQLAHVLRARLSREHENRGNRRHFVRGIAERDASGLVVAPVGTQGSGVLTSLTRANCLFVIPEDWNHAPAGALVDVIPLDDSLLAGPE
jgi:molybdopterin molybdotransferase